MAVEVRLDPSAARDIATLARRFKEMGNGKEIKRGFVKALRTGTTPAVRDTKSAARALPSSNRGKSKGLRRDIARATSAQVKTGGDARIAVRISKRALGARANLPRLMNRHEYFMHPVFGKGEAGQRGAPGWFDDVQRRAAPGVRAELERVLAEYERKLMRNV